MSKAAESWKEKGNDEFKKGNYEKAIEYYTYATECDPNNHVFYTNRSMCYATMNKWEKSLRDADTSVKLNKAWEKGYYRRGVALQKMNQQQQAVEAFETCMKIKPENEEFKKAYENARREMFRNMPESEILKTEGNELFKTGKIDQAISRYTQALAKVGNDDKGRQIAADIYANRAACYVQLYEPVKVKADCDAALKLQPNHIKALLRRGQSLESLEKYKDALADFEHALQIDPNQQMAVQAAVRLRNTLRRLGQL